MAFPTESETTDEDQMQQTTSPGAKLDAALFRRKLMSWYRSHARELPWRGINDPYRTWLSEVMLQQTRVAAVIEHYDKFLRRFPTMLSLALASESDVLGGERERQHRGESPQELVVVLDDGCDPRLLEHHLGEPGPVGIVDSAPGQLPCMA